MTTTNTLPDDELTAALRESVSSIDLTGGGPDLDVVHRRGAARRRRRRAASAVAAAAVAAVGVLGVQGLPGLPGAPGPEQDVVRSGPAAAPPVSTSDWGTARAALDGAIDRAGVRTGSGRTFGRGEVDGIPGYSSWSSTRQVPGDPDVELVLTVYPAGSTGDPDPCAPGGGGELEVRACSTVALDGGATVVSHERLDTHSWGLDDGSAALRWTMWIPTATASYPDGRTVTATVRPVSTADGRTPPVEEVQPYPGTVTLEQLGAVVSDPALTGIGVPASDTP